MFKIIGVDNFGRENISDILHSDGYPLEDEAGIICRKLNSTANEFTTRWYKVVPQNQPLYTWEP